MDHAHDCIGGALVASEITIGSSTSSKSKLISAADDDTVSYFCVQEWFSPGPQRDNVFMA